MAASLRDRIRTALADHLDTDGFEACAAELLRPRYGSLKWVPGSNDAGQDGLGETREGKEFLFVVTTEEDPARNLRNSIKSYQDAAGDRTSVVLATNRVVTGRSQLTLPAKLKEELGVDLLDIHERETFVELLAEHPHWRKELLGLSRGPAGALTRQFQRDNADLRLGLIGRDDELQALSGASGDLIVFGVPGVGKSYLLEHLCQDHDWGWLVRDHDQPMPELADEIVEERPVRVIVDDAHFDSGLQLLTRLSQLRQEIEHPFEIVACCWEDRTDDVAACLPQARRMQVPLLERNDIGAVLRKMDVYGPPQLVAEIIKQARGRVGLAVTLARASREGRGWDVVTGRMLTRQALKFNERLFSDDFLFELGVIALTDEDGLSQEQVVEALGTDSRTVANAIRRAASSGTIENHPYDRRRLRVQPRSLRFGLVRKAFFGGPGSLDLERVLEKLENPAAAAIPLIVVAAEERALDRRLITRLIDWNDVDSAAVFAELGLEEFEQAAANAPQHLPRIARAGIRAHGLSERLLTVLLYAAEPVKSRRQADSDHPLAIVRSHLSSRFAAMADRIVVVQTAGRWADQGGNLEVAGEAAMASVSPWVDDSELDPVNQDQISIYYGIQPVEFLRELESVWDQLLSFLRNHPQIPPRLILDALHPWVSPGTMRDGGPIPSEARQALRETARQVVAELATIYDARPIAMRRLSRMATRVEVEVAPWSGQFIHALYASRDPKEDDRVTATDEPTEDAKDTIRVVAGQRALRGPSDLADEIVAVEVETIAVGVGLPPLLKMYVAELATRVPSPVGFARALVERHSHSWLVDAATSVLAPEPTADFQQLIEELLSADQYRRVGTRLGLQPGVHAAVRTLAIEALRPDQADDVVFYSKIGMIAPHELQAIVEDSESRLGQEVALSALHDASAAQRDGLDLQDSLHTACRSRVAGYLRQPSSDTHQSWMLEQVLRRDSALCTEWIENWMKAAVQDRSEWFPRELEGIADTLAADQKKRLIKAVPPQLSSFQVGRLVRGLIDNDDELIRLFLQRNDLDHLRDAMFEDDIDEKWLHRAELARQAGCSAEQIAQWTTSGRFGWSGDASAEWGRIIGLLQELRILASDGSREMAIDAVDACIFAFERRKSYALEEERQERIFGRSW
ncbi:MAG: ATP-binding protein [Bryobacterales bacterium]|nr:ATP-binding protein [Bryobacterales bacterium]